MPTGQQGFSGDASQFGKQMMDALKDKADPPPPQDYAKATERQLSFGQKAVGLTFNPGNNAKVEAIKNAYANVIDLLQDYKVGNPSDLQNGEVVRMLSIAITETQTAQMWAVKAVTWQY